MPRLFLAHSTSNSLSALYAGLKLACSPAEPRVEPARYSWSRRSSRPRHGTGVRPRTDIPGTETLREVSIEKETGKAWKAHRSQHSHLQQSHGL